MALIGDPIYSDFSKGFRGLPRAFIKFRVYSPRALGFHPSGLAVQTQSDISNVGMRETSRV